MSTRPLAFICILILASPFALSMSPSKPKPKSLAFERISPAHRGKPSQPVTVSLKEPSSIPETGDDEVTIEAKIANRRKAQDLHFQWELPADVSATKESISGVLTTQGKEEVSLKITVKGFNKESQKSIILKVTAAGFTASDIVVSRPEDTLEHVAPVIRRQVEEFEAQKEKGSKEPSQTTSE